MWGTRLQPICWLLLLSRDLVRASLHLEPRKSDVILECGQNAPAVDLSKLSIGRRVMFKSHPDAGSSNYPKDSNCVYKIQRGNICKTARIICGLFDLAKDPEAKSCVGSSDHLLINGGSSELNQRYCMGHNPDFETDWPVLDISFRSGGSESGLGFVCQAVCSSYDSSDAMEAPPTKRDIMEYANTLNCGETFDVASLNEGQRIKFMSHPEFRISNYLDNFDCNYKITRGSRCNKMKIQCMDFELTTQSAIHGICQFEGDYLNFNGGPNTIMDKRYCATLTPNFTTSWPELNVHFHSDDHTNGRGFECVLECIKYTTMRKRMNGQDQDVEKRSRVQADEAVGCGKTLEMTNPPGQTHLIQSHPGYDLIQGSHYENNELCRYQVKLGPSCNAIKVECPNMSLADASTCGDKLDFQLRAGNQIFCGSDSPSLMIEDQEFSVQFSSNANETSTGFQCKLVCHNQDPRAMSKRSKIQGDEFTTCSTTHDLSKMAFGDPVRIKSHPGFDGTSRYEESAECSYLFKRGETCQEMTITCPVFDLIGDEHFCSDRVTVTEFPANVTQRFCGSHGPSIITSSPEVDINFASDDTVNGIGFECHVFCSGQNAEEVTDDNYSHVEDHTHVVKRGGSGTCACGLRVHLMRIVGGEYTHKHEFPWQAGLVTRGNFNAGSTKPFCGGTLMNDKWILTAAHCAIKFKRNWKDLVVVLGEHNYTNSGESILFVSNISRLLIHPNYDISTSDNDFALLELETSVKFQDFWYIRPICYPNTFPSEGKNVGIVTGWGATNEYTGILSDTLQKINVNVYSQEECKQFYSPFSSFVTITPNMFCAGVLSGERDACQGDSGGPLIVENHKSHRFEIQGVTSWGYGCARSGFPGVYAKVLNAQQWWRPIIGPESCIQERSG